MATTSAQDTSDVEAINPVVEHNYGIQDNSVQLNCVDPTCEFATQECPNYNMASSLLNLHVEYMHQKQLKGEKEKHSNKILVPEKLELDLAEDNFEEYQFWLQRFSSYLLECGAEGPEEKFQKLVGRLSFKIHQHISDCTDFAVKPFSRAISKRSLV